MSAIAEIWMSKLSKFKPKPMTHKAKQGSQVDRTLQKDAANNKDYTSVRADTSMMSEASVFLLMDRFVPW